MGRVSQAHYDVRSRLARALETDLVGPCAQDESLAEPPLQRYICGVLYPRGMNTGLGVEEDSSIEGEGEAERDGATVDPPVSAANVQHPSSMGLTFSVDLSSTAGIEVSVHGARYSRVETEEKRPEWRRVMLELPVQAVPVDQPTRGRKIALGEGVELFYRVRNADDAGFVAVTLVIANAMKIADASKRPNEEAVFQPGISVRAIDPTGAPFVARPAGRGSIDEELRGHELLYRHARPMAVGHGCAVDWSLPCGAHADWVVETSVLPSFELRLADSNPDISTYGLGMQELAQGDRGSSLEALTQLVLGYEAWLEACEAESAELPVENSDSAAANVAQARHMAKRMRAGVEALRDQDVVWEAFRLMNESMLEQRTRDEWKKRDWKGDRPEGGDMRWRPFQMAFILLCIPGIADSESEDRRIADLLWFPTGGGKTEAYLGLVAFTIFRRRLSSEADGAGVTAIMRYTLRLLTVQQFERASLLMCACEQVRQRYPALGQERITVGLWVGQDTTPNTRAKAAEKLNLLHAGRTVTKGDPCQLRSCPWCGARLTSRNYYMVEGGRPSMVVACAAADCLFHTGLPVFLIDQDIYDYRPSLLIATVDKFATLPWDTRTAALFNRTVEGEEPPELVIQDELHLISGPLGTLVGLYETAVDALCETHGARPKVIASTATIRQADKQTAALFDREVNQFPPQVLDARYCYFASEAGPEAMGTRLYLGVYAPGTSQTTVLIRTYAALLQAAKELHDEILDAGGDADTACDPYWSLVGYFSSLRVLGGARLAVQDDVLDRLRYLAKEHDTEVRSEDLGIVELTSRRSSSELPAALARLSSPLGDEECPDVVLATNMISVGVDVPRLGLMAVMGQPQSTSEYIQATSRVGRASPGLIVTMYNAARSRDRSHYESFVPIHSALYRQVESTSVTPFSARARDRALHAILVTLVRNLDASMQANESARDLDLEGPLTTRAQDIIVDRARSVASEESSDTEAQLAEILKVWKAHATRDPDLEYWAKEPLHSLLLQAADEVAMPDSFPTLWSMRDVDKSSNIYLKGRGAGAK